MDRILKRERKKLEEENSRTEGSGVMTKKYHVWDCKIVVEATADLPAGFDYPPRMAAENAIEKAGFRVLMNASGWGGNLTKQDIAFIEEVEKQGRSEIYYAGVMDAPGDNKHKEVDDA